MAQLIADRRDVDFVLHEQMEAGELSRYEKFAEFDKKTDDLIVSEARNLAIGPGSPSTNSNLTVSYVYTDPDGDKESGSETAALPKSTRDVFTDPLRF